MIVFIVWVSGIIIISFIIGLLSAIVPVVRDELSDLGFLAIMPVLIWPFSVTIAAFVGVYFFGVYVGRKIKSLMRYARKLRVDILHK